MTPWGLAGLRWPRHWGSGWGRVPDGAGHHHRAGGTPDRADERAIAVFFRNAAFARFTIDRARWPKTAFVDRVLALPSFQKLHSFEDRCVRTPIAQHRTVLAELGAPLLAETYGTTSPRRG